MSAAGGEKNWLTSEPHHIPGYSGFLPKLSQALGKTYGYSTHELLAVRGPATVADVLAAQEVAGATNEKPLTQSAKDRWLRKRDRKFALALIPGYAGFVPKERENVGMNFAGSCALASSRFEEDYVYTCKARAETGGDQSQKEQRQLSGYLPALSASWSMLGNLNDVNRRSLDVLTRSGDVTAPLIVGYSGFIPNLRNQFGQNFTGAAGSALREFNADKRSADEALSLPVIVNREATTIEHPPRLQVYPTSGGVIPHYQGHVPGNKFSFGKTFERATSESLNSSAALSR